MTLALADVNTYHDRGFPFDLWIDKPIAMAKYWLRGKHSQIVLEYNGYRGGQPLYGYGPLE